jgi:electron transfer flavoprotein alpha subunit
VYPVLTYSEHERTALELFSAGLDLAPKFKETRFAAAWVGPNLPKDLEGHGAGEVFHATGAGLEEFTAERYTDALAAVAAEAKPQVVLIGATRNGKDLAARLAARLKAGAISEVSKLDVAADGSLVAERTFLSGNAVQVVRSNRFPVVVTIPPRALPMPGTGGGATGVKQIPVAASSRAPDVVSVEEKMKGGIRIEDAPFIVSAGRGFKKKEDLAIIEDLAKAVGAEVGCSRPLATDLAWMTEDHWVGLSGHKVRPKVYMTFGISGQIQHIAGIRDAETIISVNNDPNAPIFKNCDLGVVADLYKFIPALKAAAAKHRK